MFDRIMKKSFILIAAIALVATACDSSTTEQKIEAYDNALDEIMTSYRTRVQEIDLDESYIINGTASEEYAKAAENAENSLIALTTRTVRKNPSDTIALYALQVAANYVTGYEKLEPAVRAVKGEIAGDEFVRLLGEQIEILKRTAEGSKFVDFTVETFIGDDADGEPQFSKASLSDYVGRGKYVLVDFWSPWCAPCKRAIPALKDIYDKYHGEDFDMLSVAVWEESRNMNYRNTVDTAAVYGINWNTINNGHLEPAALYGIEAIPYLILFGPDGTILKKNPSSAELIGLIGSTLGR